MKDEHVEDLKQFIAAIISQQTADLRQDITEIKQDVIEIKQDITEIKSNITGLDQKIDNLSAFVAEALDASNEETDRLLTDHKRRIARLERKTT